MSMVSRRALIMPAWMHKPEQPTRMLSSWRKYRSLWLRSRSEWASTNPTCVSSYITTSPRALRDTIRRPDVPDATAEKVFACVSTLRTTLSVCGVSRKTRPQKRSASATNYSLRPRVTPRVPSAGENCCCTILGKSTTKRNAATAITAGKHTNRWMQANSWS